MVMEGDGGVGEIVLGRRLGGDDFYFIYDFVYSYMKSDSMRESSATPLGSRISRPPRLPATAGAA
jgi:hypothetical protein